MDVLGALESGRKYQLKVEGLPYTVGIPMVRIPGKGGQDKVLTIASFNLVGQVRLNADLGRLLARKIRSVIPDMAGVAVLTVVEKALMLTQVAAMELGLEAVAVAYNRVKPHMESERRPTIQVGADSVTSGSKFLALYERDLNLLAAAGSYILIDDVVSTGGTILALADLLDEVRRQKNLPPADIRGIFCVAQEGKSHPLLPAPLHSLATLPEPEAG